MEQFKEQVIRQALAIKWNLALMAAACFVLAALVFTAPAHRLAETLALLPWACVALGALGAVASFISTSRWVLGWTEVAMAALMLLFGLGGLLFPSGAPFAQAFALAGAFLAFYVLFTALAMERAQVGLWHVELALALLMLLVSFAGLMGFAGVDGAQALASLPLYLGGFGFLYGAVALSGVEETMEGPLPSVF